MSQLAAVSTISKGVAVTPDDYNNELEEPPLKSLDSNDLAVSIILEPMPAVLEGMSANNPFVSPVYWWNKAYKMQTGREGGVFSQQREQKDKFGRKIAAKFVDKSD